MAAMTKIPDVMRLPLTFGLSGALHAAALSGLALPPLPTGLPAQPIEVRLLEGNPDRVAAAAGVSDAAPLQTPAPEPRQERAALSSPTPSASAPPATAAALPVAHPAHLPPDEPGPERHSGPADRAAPSLASAAVPSPAAPAAVTGGDPHPAPGAAAGTIASPFLAPKALHTPAPDYPEEARWEKRTGLATLGFRVKADGSVDEVRMLHTSGHADLDAAALESLRRWRFALPPGAAPASWYRYVFRFELT